MSQADELKKMADDLDKTAQPDPVYDRAKKGLIDAIPRADFSEVTEYLESVLEKGFDGYESEFRMTVVEKAVDKVLGDKDAEEVGYLDLYNDPDINEALAKAVWEVIKGGKNLLDFLYHV